MPVLLDLTLPPFLKWSTTSQQGRSIFALDWTVIAFQDIICIMSRCYHSRWWWESIVSPCETTLPSDGYSLSQKRSHQETHDTTLLDEYHVNSLASALLKRSVDLRDRLCFTMEMKDPDYNRNELGRVPSTSPFTLWLLLISDRACRQSNNCSKEGWCCFDISGLHLHFLFPWYLNPL